MNLDEPTNIELLQTELMIREHQVTRLLEITSAINNNVSVTELIGLYTETLHNDLEIPTLALFLKDKDKDSWKCYCCNFLGLESIEQTVGEDLEQYIEVSNIVQGCDPFFNNFDIVIPVRHKETPISYALLGGLDESDNGIFERIRFVTALTSVVSVAVENKRLFNKQRQQDVISRQIELATTAQKIMLPTNEELPNTKSLQMHGVYMPIFGIGGDYFDYLPSNNEQEFAFCIADISGKGFAAALLMSNFHSALHLIFEQTENLTECVQKLNKTIIEAVHKDKFITFFIAKYNKETRILEYINAGHNPSVLVCGEEVYELDKGCTILGAFDELSNIEVGRVKLCEEALILNYTDGLSDIQNKEEEFFDIKVLKDFALQNKELSAQDFNEKLLMDVDAYKQGQPYPDDITILTCKIA